MTQVPRQRSPLAHGLDDECSSCRECAGCDGASGVTPKTYRLAPSGGALLLTCTRCDGSGVTCLNLVRERP